MIITMEGVQGCHRKGQLLLMADGSVKPVENVVVDDLLMGPDGAPRQVQSLCQGIGNMVKVHPKRGCPWVVNEDHILTLEWCSGRKEAPLEGTWVDVRVGDYPRLSVEEQENLRIPKVPGILEGFEDTECSKFQLEPVGGGEPYFGFALDGDRRYLSEDFTVFHNSGKTLSAVAMCYYDARKGRRIFSNNHLNKDAFGPYTYFDIEYFLEHFADTEMEGATLLLDEAYIYLDARTSGGKLNKLFTYYTVQTRKRGVDMYVCTHHIDVLDKRLRRAVDVRGTCFPPETRITTDSGQKKIKDVTPGMKVLSYSESKGVKEWDEVVGVGSRWADPCLKVCFDNRNQLVLTDEHPVYVVSKGWTEASELVPGDEVIQYKYDTLWQRLNLLARGSDPEWRESHSAKLRKKWSDPDSCYNREEFRSARASRLTQSNPMKAVVVQDKNREVVSESVKRFTFNPDVDVVKVVGVERMKACRKVYNVETRNNHNYFAYGILVHNCRYIKQKPCKMCGGDGQIKNRKTKMQWARCPQCLGYGETGWAYTDFVRQRTGERSRVTLLGPAFWSLYDTNEKIPVTKGQMRLDPRDVAMAH